MKYSPAIANINNLRIGMVHWHEDDGIASILSDTLNELGCQTIDFLHNTKLPPNLDVVFVYGPFGSLVPVANQLLACPPSERPLMVLWMTEQLPNPDLPEWYQYLGGLARSWVERLAFSEQTPGEWCVNPYFSWLTSKAHRFRYYGDLYWLQQQGILSILVTGSKCTADYLRCKGFDPLMAPMGTHEDWGADLKLERDIPVLWIGKMGSQRRAHLLRQIRKELKERGVEMLVVDGVEHPYIFDEERTILLNRTKIVLNLLREGWDNNAMRYYIAAPNRAMIVTEPTLPHTPFVPGIHLVEAPIENIADTICYYLSREQERQQIADQAYQLVTTELTLRQSLNRILAQIMRLRQPASAVSTIL